MVHYRARRRPQRVSFHENMTTGHLSRRRTRFMKVEIIMLHKGTVVADLSTLYKVWLEWIRGKYVRNHCQGEATEFESERLKTSRQWQLQSVRAAISSTPPIRISFAVLSVRILLLFPAISGIWNQGSKCRWQMLQHADSHTHGFHSSSPGKTRRQYRRAVAKEGEGGASSAAAPGTAESKGRQSECFK
jgi:hypothetical protein